MKRSWATWVMIGSIVCGILPVLEAAEESSKPTSASSSASTAQPAPASTSAAAPSAPKLSIAEGTVSAIDLTSLTPTVKLTGSDGKVWTIGVDLKATTVWDNGQAAQLAQVHAGQRVRVRYQEKDGKPIATAIRLEPVQKPTASTTTPAPKSY